MNANLTLTPDTTLLKQLAALPDMPLAEIKRLWQTLSDTPPPKRKKLLLVRKLTYRLQELAYGVNPDIEQRLAEQAKRYVQSNNTSQKRKRAGIVRPMVGSRLVRHYNGVDYHISVLDDRYEYDGRVYNSLSKIATLITGNNCSGIAFFGLRKAKGVTR